MENLKAKILLKKIMKKKAEKDLSLKKPFNQAETLLENGSYYCPPIHFVALIAPDLDYDILLEWIEHYKKLKLDTYTVFIHKDMNIHNRDKTHITCLLNHNGFKVSYVQGPFDDGNLRLNVMNAFAMNIPDDDYIMTADSDEFQIWPENNVRKALLDGTIDVMEGELIDCFTGMLEESNGMIPLSIQYPRREKGLEMKLDPECRLNLNKICIAKNKFPVCFVGSHDFNSDIPNKKLTHNIRTRSGIEVRHYKWRHTLKERLLNKSYNKPKHALKILSAFRE